MPGLAPASPPAPEPAEPPDEAPPLEAPPLDEDPPLDEAPPVPLLQPPGQLALPPLPDGSSEQRPSFTSLQELHSAQAQIRAVSSGRASKRFSQELTQPSKSPAW